MGEPVEPVIEGSASKVSTGQGRRPLVAVGQKSYLTYADTLAWLDAAVGTAQEFADRVDVVVFPVAPALPVAVRVSRGLFQVGAQDVSDQPPGAYTGELPAALLREIGVTHVEIGHAERRFLFGEHPDVTARKTAMAVQNGLTPLICVGEGGLGESTPVPVDEAVRETSYQLESLLPTLSPDLPFVVAYEPVWAIGAEHPAPVEHVRVVIDGLRHALAGYRTARVIYGGTAGPGLFAELSGVTDGLFLGRRAHDPSAFAAVLAEVASGS